MMIFDWLASNTAQTILVFVLLFTLIFGVLQKTKLFGDGKKQIDALIALSIALLTTSVAYALDIISQLVTFMSVGLVIVLVFILLIGLFHKDKFDPSKMTTTATWIALVAVIIAVLYFTGAWNAIADLWRDESSSVIGNIVTGIVVIGVVLFVFLGATKSSSKD